LLTPWAKPFIVFPRQYAPLGLKLEFFLSKNARKMRFLLDFLGKDAQKKEKKKKKRRR